MATRADQLDVLPGVLSTQIVVLADPAGGKLYQTTVGALLAAATPPDLSGKADLVAGKVPASELPSYVDDVLEFDTVPDLPAIGETGKLYVITSGPDAEDVFRWSGSVYIQVGGRDFGVDISTEASIRAAADITLQNNIDAEAATRAAADTTLQNNINAEASTRAAADTTLQTNINNEATARANADTTLQNNINAEANTRSNADITLQSNINAEATARAAEDVILQAEIDLKLNISDYNDHFKGKYTTLVALQAAHPTSNVGDYAQVDAGSGSNVINYNYDLDEGWVQGSSAGGGAWGTITGTLSDQTDLQTALDAKVDKNGAITGATKTKITYDAKGLVTAGADATTTDIADSTNKRYVTDAEKTVIDNTSGVNTGDQDLSGKLTKNSPITGATKTKITYDANGLVTAGADATTADIADSTNKRYVTDAEKTVIDNTSGVNTGDQDLSGKVSVNVAITGATKTKITYDAKGLVTVGADATTTDIAEGTNKYYTAARVLAEALAGFVSTTGTITSADSILTALEKLAGNHDAVALTVSQKILSIAGNYSQSIL